MKFVIVAAVLLLPSTTEPQEVSLVTPQMTVPCEIVEVYDGDTVTVRLTLDVRVRLLDCWSPEIKTRDAVEKKYGIHSRETMKELLQGEQLLLEVPLSGVDRFDELFTFGRLLARLKLVKTGLDVSEEMVRMGTATEEKK